MYIQANVLSDSLQILSPVSSYTPISTSYTKLYTDRKVLSAFFNDRKEFLYTLLKLASKLAGWWRVLYCYVILWWNISAVSQLINVKLNPHPLPNIQQSLKSIIDFNLCRSYFVYTIGAVVGTASAWYRSCSQILNMGLVSSIVTVLIDSGYQISLQIKGKSYL